jgi:MFS family permease
MVYSNCFHLFAYISAAFIADRFSTSLAEAGWLAGLSNGLAIFLCPLAGIAMDYVGYKMWIQVIAGVVTTTAYLLLLASAVSPVPSLVLLAICVSFTPTILKSSVPNLVLPAVYGSLCGEQHETQELRRSAQRRSSVRPPSNSTHRSFACVLVFPRSRSRSRSRSLSLHSSAYGIYEIMESVGSVVGNMAVGFFRDSTHSWDLDLAVFAGMGATATALTVLLIFLDFMGWIGLGAGAPVGALNQSSFQTKLQQDQLKKRKDRFLQKESRWKVIEQQQREEMEHEAQILHVEDGHVFTPTNKEAMAAAAGVATACSRV